VEEAPSRLTLVELGNAVGKLPPLPGGRPRRRGRELSDTLDWGTGATNYPGAGVPQAIQAIASLTMDRIVAAGITLEEASVWCAAYHREASRTDIDNVSAGPREQLMRCIEKMLASNEAFVSPDTCCQ
jgi:hypothetical protein